MAEAIDGVDQRLPEIFQILIDKALAGDKECAIYLVDRVLGRPRLSIDANTKVEVALDPSMMLQALREVREIEAQWLLSPIDPQLGPPSRPCATTDTQLAPVDSQSSSDTADAGMGVESDEKTDAAQEGTSPTV
jgi:hypothetical protein